MERQIERGFVRHYRNRRHGKEALMISRVKEEGTEIDGNNSPGSPLSADGTCVPA